MYRTNLYSELDKKRYKNFKVLLLSILKLWTIYFNVRLKYYRAIDPFASM